MGKETFGERARPRCKTRQHHLSWIWYSLTLKMNAAIAIAVIFMLHQTWELHRYLIHIGGSGAGPDVTSVCC